MGHVRSTSTTTSPPQRRSPGRVPKAYTLAPGEWHISLPERHYALLADMLTRAVLSCPPSEPARQAALRVATETGHQLGQHARMERRLGRLGPERALSAAGEALDNCSYEPDRVTGSLVLRNCPFAQLATTAPDLICILNQHLITGLGATQHLRATLVPTHPGCCVQIHTDHPTTPSPTTG